MRDVRDVRVTHGELGFQLACVPDRDEVNEDE
jgi:hypothetical protein